MAEPAVIRTTCSGCSEPVLLNTVSWTVVARVPSNGRRGSLHVPAHDVRADLSGDDHLLMWDCPRCEYADSYDLDQ